MVRTLCYLIDSPSSLMVSSILYYIKDGVLLAVYLTFFYLWASHLLNKKGYQREIMKYTLASLSIGLSIVCIITGLTKGAINPYHHHTHAHIELNPYFQLYEIGVIFITLALLIAFVILAILIYLKAKSKGKKITLLFMASTLFIGESFILLFLYKIMFSFGFYDFGFHPEFEELIELFFRLSIFMFNVTVMVMYWNKDNIFEGVTSSQVEKSTLQVVSDDDDDEDDEGVDDMGDLEEMTNDNYQGFDEQPTTTTQAVKQDEEETTTEGESYQNI